MASDKQFFQETWFELVFGAGCALLGYFLFQALMPPVHMGEETVQTVAMAKLFADGRFSDAFMRYNQPPIYPLLLSLVIHFRHVTDLPRLIDGFQQLNFGLYVLSVGAVYAFVRRQIRKPYTFIITALYAVAPATLEMAWQIGPGMAYILFSMLTLLAIDYSLSKESAEGGNISRGELLLSGSLIGLSILTHQIGYTLLVAFFFIMLKRFGLKKSALVLGVMILCVSPFIGRDVFNVVKRPNAYVASSAELVHTAGRRGILKTVQIYADDLFRSVAHHAIGDFDMASLGRRDTHAGHQISLDAQPWGRWALGALALVGTLYGLYQYTGVGSLYLCAYVITALVLLPSTHISLTPVLPLLLFYLYFGVARTGEWMKRLHLPVSKIIGPALTVWILLCTFSTHLSQAGHPAGQLSKAVDPRVIMLSTAKQPETRLEEAQTNSAHRRAMDWLKDHSTADAKVARPRPEAAGMLLKGEESKGGSQGAIRKELSRYDYLWEEEATRLAPAARQYDRQRGLRLVYEDAPGGIRIWQVQPTPH